MAMSFGHVGNDGCSGGCFGLVLFRWQWRRPDLDLELSCRGGSHLVDDQLQLGSGGVHEQTHGKFPAMTARFLGSCVSMVLPARLLASVRVPNKQILIWWQGVYNLSSDSICQHNVRRRSSSSVAYNTSSTLNVVGAMPQPDDEDDKEEELRMMKMEPSMAQKDKLMVFIMSCCLFLM